MKKFNLLYIIDGGENYGGAEENLLNVLKVMDKREYSVEVCCLVGGYVAEVLKTSGVPVTVLNMKNKWDCGAVLRLVAMLKRKDIHILHTSLYASNTFGRIAAILARAPITISWEQGMANVKPRRHTWVDRFLSKFTDSITVPSEAVRQSIIKEENISREKIEVIHNFVDEAEFAIAIDLKTKREELGLKLEDIVVGYVGCLSEHKGHKYLLDAIPEIILNIPGVKFLLVGEGPLRGQIEEKIKRMGLEAKVILLGFRRDIAEILSIIDLYVHPSLSETFGLSIIEAMFMGKPVVASNIDGIPEVVKDEETGILIPARDFRRMAEAVIGLLKDRERASKMGRAGSELVRTNFTPEAAVEKLERLYEKFLVRKILTRKKSLSEEEEEIRRAWIKRHFAYGDGKFIRNPARDYEEETRRKGLLKLLKPMPGERVLDVGCGRCGDILFFSSRGAKFIGIDFSELSVVEGRRNLKDAGEDTPLMVADALRLPFRDEAFDKVCCKEVLEHIPNYETAIEEIARVLKVGGIAAITCPNWLSMNGLWRVFSELKRWILNRGAYHPCDDWRTQRMMERSLKKYGFEIKDKLGIDFLPGIICYKLPSAAQKSLIGLIRFIEFKFLWRLTALGNTVGLSAVKKNK